MGRWVNGDWEWGWSWRRELRERDISVLNDLCFVLNRVKLVEGVEDKWCWLEKEAPYSVKEGYSFLYQRAFCDSEPNNLLFSQLWDCGAIAKVKMHAWRVIRRRIPVRVELRRRHSLPNNCSVVCPFCNEKEETIEHVCFECRLVTEVWNECKKWMGFSAAFPEAAMQHFLSFSNIFASRIRRQISACIWVGLVWIIWNVRNAVIFKEGKWDAGRIMSELKVRTWF